MTNATNATAENAGTITVGICWFFVIAVMFFAQHHVCDAYFVPAINVFVATMKKSDKWYLRRWGEEAVAGATICALGCNGPELFTNLIALFTGSDAGIGVVVGSEIFNLLIIVGAATLAAPVSPLEVERGPFVRDCLFYGASIVLLYWTLNDNPHKNKPSVSRMEACILLGCCVVYVLAVYFTTNIVQCCTKQTELSTELLDQAANEASSNKRSKFHGVVVKIEEKFHGRMADAGALDSATQAKIDAIAGVGNVPGGLYVAPQNDSSSKKKQGRSSIGFNFADNPDGGSMLAYKDLTEVVLLDDKSLLLEFRRNVLEHITLKLSVEDDVAGLSELVKRIEANSLNRALVHQYDASVFGTCTHAMHVIKHGDCFERLFLLPEFLIDFMLKLTLFPVDVKKVGREGRWPLCFLGAMAWLAAFSYAMLEVAEQINYNIPQLTTAFLGITVCAIGTSFPNAVASVIMAKQNKPAAAIANALGSNVQNVFLAMAFPWVIYSFTKNKLEIEQNAQGVTKGVLWMMGTLILMVVVVALRGGKIDKATGGLFMLIYVVYLVLTSIDCFTAR